MQDYTRTCMLVITLCATNAAASVTEATQTCNTSSGDCFGSPQRQLLQTGNKSNRSSIESNAKQTLRSYTMMNNMGKRCLVFMCSGCHSHMPSAWICV
jgi:hypothetical protein